MIFNVFRFCFLAITLTILVRADDFPSESGFKSVYNNYKQCENDAEMVSCLKLKALKLMDRALAINTIPIIEGVTLTKKEGSQRSLSDITTNSESFDENNLPSDSEERSRKLDTALWEKVGEFFESRSLQLKVDKLFFGDDVAGKNGEDGRGKKDKNKGMYMYMMMKGGLMALAYKGLALLAGKALLVSKIALTLAVVVAIKKLFTGGHHSQKTTYEIVKTPIITHSHQYSGANPQNGPYTNEFSNYEGAPYARSLADNPTEEVNRRVGFKPVELQTPTRYVTQILETVEGRSLSNGSQTNENKDSVESGSRSNSDFGTFSLPYAHLVAYKNQLAKNNAQAESFAEKFLTTPGDSE